MNLLMNFSKSISVGFAIFAMLFGAGNVVFPLGLGRTVGDQVFFALLGLCISAIIVPVIGLISAMLFEGRYKDFLGTMGSIPGALIAFICMILLGPFGAIPRCLTLANAVARWYFPTLSSFFFMFCAVILIFICTMRKNLLVDLLAKFFAPLKLILLFSIILFGLINPITPPSTGFLPLGSFLFGLQEGFWMLDLLGTIFFSGLILGALRKKSNQSDLTAKDIMIIGLQGGILGGTLLGLVYAGFCLIAAMYSPLLDGVAQDQILSALAMAILGPRAAVIANITVAISCLTTALALTAVFADYVRNQIFNDRVSYLYALLITSVCTFIMANLGFAGIMKVIAPIVITCYPALAVLSMVNIANKLWGFKYVKTPVFVTFVITMIFNFLR